jgi:uncharacterized membrane protein YqgA involved in biofilm formation
LAGVALNALAVLVGGLLGCLTGDRVPAAVRDAALRGIALAVTIIGLSMALASHASAVLLVASLALGTAAGVALHLRQGTENLAAWLGSRAAASRHRTAQAFVTASLLFCVGPLAVVASLQAGLGSLGPLVAKAGLDGTSALVLAAGLGPGVALAALPVLVYQGLIVLFAGALGPLLTAPGASAALSATGGAIVAAMGLTMLRVADLDPIDMVPALVLAVALAHATAAFGIPAG